jgi:hypothetical protein
MQLETELAIYEGMLPDFLKEHEGDYVLIKGDRVEGFWKTKEEAITAGVQRFPLQPFLAKKIERHTKPVVIPVVQCRP